MCQCSQNTIMANYKQKYKTNFLDQIKPTKENLIFKTIFPWARPKAQSNSTSQNMAQRASKSQLWQVDSALCTKASSKNVLFMAQKDSTPRLILRSHPRKTAVTKRGVLISSCFYVVSDQTLWLCSIGRRIIAQKKNSAQVKVVIS